MFLLLSHFRSFSYCRAYPKTPLIDLSYGFELICSRGRVYPFLLTWNLCNLRYAVRPLFTTRRHSDFLLFKLSHRNISFRYSNWKHTPPTIVEFPLDHSRDPTALTRDGSIITPTKHGWMPKRRRTCGAQMSVHFV